jgi:hypothetical protein
LQTTTAAFAQRVSFPSGGSTGQPAGLPPVTELDVVDSPVGLPPVPVVLSSPPHWSKA